MASGYKVWPREVEDVLYTHEAVLEAGVVGVPDPYRGETVKAYVSLRRVIRLDPDELIAYCREPARGVQVSPSDRDRRRHTQDGDRQDPAPGVTRRLSYLPSGFPTQFE